MTLTRTLLPLPPLWSLFWSLINILIERRLSGKCSYSWTTTNLHEHLQGSWEVCAGWTFTNLTLQSKNQLKLIPNSSLRGWFMPIPIYGVGETGTFCCWKQTNTVGIHSCWQLLFFSAFPLQCRCSCRKSGCSVTYFSWLPKGYTILD